MNKLMAEDIYYYMVLGRNFEYAAKDNYMRGNVSGFLHLDIGQEGFSVAAIKAFDKGDIFSTYRDHVIAIARGLEPRAVMAELFGKSTGISGGKGGSMHLFEPSRFFYGGEAIVSGHLTNAVGCAYARKTQGIDDGVMVIFGDGASNQGALFESLNIAATNKLPILFVCENNGYAMGTKITSTAPFKEQSKKAEPYMQTYTVDGNDPEAVYDCIKETQIQIQKGHGPFFVEVFTYRFEGHSVSESTNYRPAQELSIAKNQDALPRFKAELKEKWMCSDDYIKALEEKAQKIVDEAVEFAKNSAEPPLNALYENIFFEEV